MSAAVKQDCMLLHPDARLTDAEKRQGLRTSPRPVGIQVHEGRVMNTRLIDFAALSEQHREAAAAMRVEQFDEPSGWPSYEAGRDEVTHIVQAGFALAALEGERLIGWIGGLPEYSGRVWELHPLVVHRGHRRRGVVL